MGIIGMAAGFGVFRVYLEFGKWQSEATDSGARRTVMVKVRPEFAGRGAV